MARPCHREMRIFFSCMTWRAIPSPLSKLHRVLAVQGTHKSLLQHHSSKASILQRSAFFTDQLSHPCMTTGKTREANILAAEEALKALPGVEGFKTASIYETEPVGLEDQPYFLNTCAGFYTDIDPFELLDKIHVIDSKLLRTREIHWGPRTIDIDIIFYGDRVIMKPELTVPHPRWNLRSFVTVPLRELKDVGQDHPDDKEVSLYRKRG